MRLILEEKKISGGIYEVVVKTRDRQWIGKKV
jgi:hypothetical protein